MNKADAVFWGKMFAAAYLMIVGLAIVLGLMFGLVAWLGGWGILIWVLAFPPMLMAGVVIADKFDRWAQL